MYSAVLVMALAGSAGTQGFEPQAYAASGINQMLACHNRCGCTGYHGGCGGCYGGCTGYYGGCTGSYGGCSGYYSGCTGCYGGCTGYYGGCNGYANNCGGCRGGLFSCFRGHNCCGTAYYGCTGCYGNYGCTGTYYGCTGCTGTMAPAPAVKTMPKTAEPLPPPADKKGEVSAPATIVVSLPANAKLTIDGYVSRQTSSQRTLVTVPIRQGQELTYTLVAEGTENGQSISQTQRVTVRGGQQMPVTFDFTAIPAAARR
jgi:uncharacterized protein (TIGR03000 family)